MVLTVSLYGYALIAAFALGLFTVCKGLHDNKVPANIIFYSVFLNLAFIFYGAKLYTVILSGFTIDWFQAGISSLGAVSGMLVGSVIFSLIYGKKKQLFLHMYLLAAPGMYGVAKLGCFSAGCCRGIAYDGILSVSYHTKNLQTSPVFPIQLLESIVFLAIYVVGIRLYRKRHNDRAVAVVIFLCSVAKFSLEFLREEHIGVTISMNQWVCTGFALWAIWLYHRKGKKSRNTID